MVEPEPRPVGLESQWQQQQQPAAPRLPQSYSKGGCGDTCIILALWEADVEDLKLKYNLGNLVT